MSTYRRFVVEEVKLLGPRISEVGIVDSEGRAARGIVLEELAGPVESGDEVVANTTAVELGLGSGGYHFVLWNLSRDSLDTRGDGHIMKLRYTPAQLNVRAMEEDLCELRNDELPELLGGMPVIAGELHSQLLPVALAFRDRSPSGRLVYVMTDGGCLPAVFSNAARYLRKSGFLEAVISCGHAFGGDFEAVTVHGALAAAKKLLEADAAVVLMGPGTVGTGSPVGSTGIEQGEVVNAAAALGGTPVAIPRIAFRDDRERHHGLSHHTAVALGTVAVAPALIPVPEMEPRQAGAIDRQIEEAGLGAKHQVRKVDARRVLELMDRCPVAGSVMGRGPGEEPEFFMAAGAAGFIAAEGVGER